jgi:hypothetical protein
MLADKKFSEKDFAMYVIKVFGLMQPLNAFLDRALNG